MKERSTCRVSTVILPIGLVHRNNVMLGYLYAVLYMLLLLVYARLRDL